MLLRVHWSSLRRFGFAAAVLIIAVAWCVTFSGEFVRLMIPHEQSAIGQIANQSDHGLPFPHRVCIRPQSSHRLAVNAHLLGKTPYSHHYALIDGDDLILAIVPAEHGGEEYCGTLQPLSQYEDTHVVRAASRRFPNKRIVSCRLNMSSPTISPLCMTTLAPLLILVTAGTWLMIILFSVKKVSGTISRDGPQGASH